MAKFNVLDHVLVPKHEVVNPEDTEALLKHFRIERGQLPKIKGKDPAVVAIGGNVGDVIRITRESLTAGTAVVYRLVIG